MQKFLFAIPFVCALAATALAGDVAIPPVLDIEDPDFRFWVAADDLVAAGLENEDDVTEWVDRVHGTIMAPRDSFWPNGPGAGFPVEEAPKFELFELELDEDNVIEIPAVRFDAVEDPFLGERDRLFQSNNWDDLSTEDVNEDPTDVGNPSDLTMFVVYRPTFTTTPALGFQPLVVKRSDDVANEERIGAPYQLGIHNTGGPLTGTLNYVTFQQPVEWNTGAVIDEQVWHVTAMTIEEASNPETEDDEGDILKFFDDASEDGAARMEQLPNFPGEERIIGRNTRAGFPPGGQPNGLPGVPLGLGGHAQQCCGEGESYDGYISEVILFSRLLSDEEFADVEDYINAKYFGFGPPDEMLVGDYNMDETVNAPDYNIWRDTFGDLVDPPGSGADGNLDGEINAQDYNVWRDNFGNQLEAAASVPEPSAVVMILIGLAGMLVGRRM